MPLKNGKLTPQERKFSEVYSRTSDAQYSADKAAYAHPQTKGYQKLMVPAVQEDIRRRQVAMLNNELVPMALGLLRDFMADTKESSRIRLDSGKTVLAHAKLVATEETAMELHEMTQAQLERDIARNAALIEELQAQEATIEHEPIAEEASVFD